MKIKKHKSIVDIKKVGKKNELKEKMVDKIASFLEMPEGIISDNIKMTLIDNKFFYLEGNNQIVDYYSHYIKVKTNKVTISLDGKNMDIKEISDKELVIEGEILSVSLNK